MQPNPDGEPMARQITRRPLIRHIAVCSGAVACPRNGRIQADACGGCAFACRDESLPDSVACSYPIPATETFLARSRRREDVRFALSMTLERS